MTVASLSGYKAQAVVVTCRLQADHDGVGHDTLRHRFALIHLQSILINSDY